MTQSATHDHPELSVDLYDGIPRLRDFEVAQRLPVLSDAGVSEAVQVAEAYEYTRSCSLALSGIVLMQHFDIASMASLNGVIGTIKTDLGRARAACARAHSSSQPAIRGRVEILMRAIAVLDEQVALISRGAILEPSVVALRTANNYLRRCDSYELNMLHVGSLSCAADTGELSTLSSQFIAATSPEPHLHLPGLATTERDAT